MLNLAFFVAQFCLASTKQEQFSDYSVSKILLNLQYEIVVGESLYDDKI